VVKNQLRLIRVKPQVKNLRVLRWVRHWAHLRFGRRFCSGNLSQILRQLHNLFNFLGHQQRGSGFHIAVTPFNQTKITGGLTLQNLADTLGFSAILRFLNLNRSFTSGNLSALEGSRLLYRQFSVGIRDIRLRLVLTNSNYSYLFQFFKNLLLQ